MQGDKADGAGEGAATSHKPAVSGAAAAGGGRRTRPERCRSLSSGMLETYRVATDLVAAEPRPGAAERLRSPAMLDAIGLPWRSRVLYRILNEITKLARAPPSGFALSAACGAHSTAAAAGLRAARWFSSQ